MIVIFKKNAVMGDLAAVQRLLRENGYDSEFKPRRRVYALEIKGIPKALIDKICVMQNVRRTK
ncbi:MAG: hypothetical protein Q8N56_04530 [bacterium]|nr:hypothetical protein [bacterium]